MRTILIAIAGFLASCSTAPAPVAVPKDHVSGFASATISDLAAMFNKRSSNLKFEVVGDRGELWDYRLNFDDPEEWITELKTLSSVRVDRRVEGTEIVTITVQDTVSPAT